MWYIEVANLTLSAIKEAVFAQRSRTWRRSGRLTLHYKLDAGDVRSIGIGCSTIPNPGILSLHGFNVHLRDCAFIQHRVSYADPVFEGRVRHWDQCSETTWKGRCSHKCVCNFLLHWIWSGISRKEMIPLVIFPHNFVSTWLRQSIFSPVSDRVEVRHVGTKGFLWIKCRNRILGSNSIPSHFLPSFCQTILWRVEFLRQ